MQPAAVHEHWHIDITYITIHGTFYYFCAVLDGASRYIVDWSLRDAITEVDIEVFLQRAKEKFPTARPRIISDNGPHFVAKDFKEFIRISGMTHVRTSPYYPQSNGKLERWNGSIKSECIRPGVPLTLADAERLIAQYVQVYNGERLHSANRLCNFPSDTRGPPSGNPRGARPETRAGAPRAPTSRTARRE